MQILKNAAYAAILVGCSQQALALDLSTYPDSFLGAKANAKAAMVKGTAVCTLKGLFYKSGSPVNYSGHVRLTLDGIQDSNGFGHFTSPTGKESFVQYSLPYSVSDGNGGFTEGGVTCVHLLDTASSKYAFSKYGAGISELHWNADENNVQTCPAFVDQIGWVVDKAGHSITTKINDTPTTVMGEQSAECYKAF